MLLLKGIQLCCASFSQTVHRVKVGMYLLKVRCTQLASYIIPLYKVKTLK